MPEWLNGWNRRLSRWLWLVVFVGIIASLPVMMARAQTESSADDVAIVVDYKDLLQTSTTKGDPEAFLDEQLDRLKQAGVNGLAVFESTLEELTWSGEVAVYTAAEAALLEGKAAADYSDNRTYVLFTKPEEAQTLRPIIDWAFRKHGTDVQDWSYEGKPGVSIGMGFDDAVIRPMQPNPIAMKKLHEAGFQLFPRLSDRFDPYDVEEMDKWLDEFQALGVTRVMFDGDAVPGFDMPTKTKSVQRFSQQLEKHGIGIGAFENLKAQMKGIGSVAKWLEYDVVRAHSVSDGEMAILKTEQLEDRLLLAVKDRDVRILYLNATSLRDAVKARMSNPLDLIVDTLQGDDERDGLVKRFSHFGFSLGVPKAFDVHHAPAESVLRVLAMAGAIALVALLIGLYLPSLLTVATVLGYVGAAGLYVLKPTLMTQMLALFVAIAAPTVAVVLLIRKIRDKRDIALSTGRRVGASLLLFLRTSVLSLVAVPLVVAMLNHISYSLVLQQFRGVSLLHLAPIALAAVYVFLYGPGGSVIANARRILTMPVTFFWVVLIGVGAAAGMYYLTRTGNAGQVSAFELKFRWLLENTFGVRPRTKEFLIGHPLMLVGIFAALRYRWATLLVALATIAQLSMVDAFAHIHTPLILSIMRVALGLGIGLLIGLVALVVWRLIERAWARFEKTEGMRGHIG